MPEWADQILPINPILYIHNEDVLNIYMRAKSNIPLQNDSNEKLDFFSSDISFDICSKNF